VGRGETTRNAVMHTSARVEDESSRVALSCVKNSGTTEKDWGEGASVIEYGTSGARRFRGKKYSRGRVPGRGYPTRVHHRRNETWRGGKGGIYSCGCNGITRRDAEARRLQWGVPRITQATETAGLPVTALFNSPDAVAVRPFHDPETRKPDLR
jgi:hypothetical protein